MIMERNIPSMRFRRQWSAWAWSAWAQSHRFVDWAHEHASRDKQIEIIAALTEGVGVRATARLTGVNRETVGKLALQIGKGCAELHDRRMVGVRVNRIELDEVWSF